MLKFFMINNGLEQTRQKIKNFDRYIYLLQDSAIRQPGTRICGEEIILIKIYSLFWEAISRVWHCRASY